MRGALLAGLVLWLTAPLSLAAQAKTVSPHGKLKLGCEACHAGGSWSEIRIGKRFDHRSTGFPLAGAHQGAACRACHVSVDFAGAATTCAACHEDVHRGELGPDCARCHTPRSFLDRTAMARAHQATRFPLDGTHLTADCTACHRPAGQGQLRFVGLGTECWNCHQADYAATQAPNHTALGMPHNCQQCHSATIWERGRYNHDVTRFPLTGAHRATPCLQCHGDNVYAGKPTDCVACHQANYDATTNPPHATAGFATNCASCHTTVRWDDYDHSRTGFPLSGAHLTVPCLQCHVGGVFAGTPTACVGCHQADFNGTTNPNHTQLGFSTNCTLCHTSTTTWLGASFDHSKTAFPLTGAHTAVACTQCHVGGVYAGTPTACVGCHQATYTGTTDPNHAKIGLGTDCKSCHTTTTWNGAKYTAHDALYRPTIYSGEHKGKWSSCLDCHVNSSPSATCTKCHS